MYQRPFCEENVYHATMQNLHFTHNPYNKKIKNVGKGVD